MVTSDIINSEKGEVTMEEINEKFKIIINHELLEEFCNLNDFLIITKEMLEENNIFENLVYATDNNFVGQSVYPKNMPLMMNKILWGKLIKINDELKKQNRALKICDAYRPIEVQKIFWEKFYNVHGYYDESLVANPEKYGTHNIKLNAVDIILVDINGNEVELPCEFDDFTEKASINYEDCSEIAKQNRDLLIKTANKYGLIVNENEWWHYYDEGLKEFGMRYDYSNSEMVPERENEVFILTRYIN